MRKNLLLNLTGALVVTILHVAIFGYQGLGAAAILVVSIFVAFLVMDKIIEQRRRFGSLGVILLFLMIATVISFPVSLILNLSHVVEITSLVALVFATVGGGSIMLSSWKRRGC